MPSQALKYFNKFLAWSRHEGVVHIEDAAAQEEFFANPAVADSEAKKLVFSLFMDWFLFDRKLTRCGLTPLELFIRERSSKLKPKELSVYRRFADSNIFGLFRAEAVESGRWMDLRAMPGGKTHRVIDELGSRQAERGDCFIARIVPYEDHWAIPGFITALPEEAGAFIQEELSLAPAPDALEKEKLRPRDVLALFAPKIDWHAEGLPRVKARLASILQRWGVKDTTVSMVEEEIVRAHARRGSMPPIFEDISRKAPFPKEAREVIELLAAFWNLMIVSCRPDLDPKTVQKGPVEKRLFTVLTSRMAKALPEKDSEDPEKARQAFDQLLPVWLDEPQEALHGKTPRQAILEERRSMGNPLEEIAYRIEVSQVALDSSPWEEGEDLANRAREHLFKGEAKLAAELYAKAYPLMKGHPGLFRVLGNLAGAYIRLGRREEALDALRAALKANPDYAAARNNLRLLESMSAEEYERRFKEGFFNKFRDVRN